MDVKFMLNGKKAMHAVPGGIWRALFFCIVFFGSLQGKAQALLPLGEEFTGEWTFAFAKAQERPFNSGQDYVTRTVPENEVTFTVGLPGRFFLNDDGYIGGMFFPYGDKPVVLFGIDPSSNLLRIFDVADPENLSLPPLFPPDEDLFFKEFSNWNADSNLMNMQYNYNRFDDVLQENIEVILTVYYQKAM